MGHGRNRIYFGISFLVSSIPAWAGIYCMANDRTTWSVVLIALSIICMGISTLLFVGYKTIKHGAPIVSRVLNGLNSILWPVARGLSRTRIVGPVISACIRSTFFIWFMVLLMSDHGIRWVLRLFVNRHASGHNFSVINAMNTSFDLFDETIPATKDLQDSKLFQRRKSEAGAGRLFQRPRYSLPLAYTLCVASKLVYEDVAVIRYELERAGFDVVKSFRPIAYQNICAFIVEKDNDILLVFRGTNPLNIQNYITNVNTGLCDVRGRSGSNMGKVHKGFWKAMGDPPVRQVHHPQHIESHGNNNNNNNGGSNPTEASSSDSRVQIVLNNTSLYRTIASAVHAVVQVLQFLTLNLFHYVSDPVDTSWTGPDVDVRTNTMFAQAEKHILDLMTKHNHRKEVDDDDTTKHHLPARRLFITGHSLGGALGTIFLAKMVQSKSPCLEHFGGLYTFGQPKIGDADFARSFDTHMSNKIFHHAYNNDVVTRIPLWAPYDTPPGTLVYISSDYDITLYPPDPLTGRPVPIRRISFLHLSGVLNRYVIRRMVHENTIRILFRFVFPFFLNDHFPSDYCSALRHGTTRWVVMGTAGLQGGEEEEEEGGGYGTSKYPNQSTTRRASTSSSATTAATAAFANGSASSNIYSHRSSVASGDFHQQQQQQQQQPDIVTLQNHDDVEPTGNEKRQSF